MSCDNCEKRGVRVRRISRAYGRGDNLLVIENIPVLTCPHCEASYLTAETLHEIERIKSHRSQLTVQRPVEVASLA